MENIDRSEKIIRSAVDKLAFTAKTRKDLRLSEEFISHLERFLSTKDVNNGIKCLLVKKLEVTPECQFDAIVEDLEGRKSIKKVSLAWTKNNKVDTYGNLLLIALEKSLADPFVNYCKNRDIPYAYEVSKFVDFSKGVQMLRFNDPDQFVRILPGVSDATVLIGQENLNEFDKKSSVVFIQKNCQRVFAFNPKSPGFAVMDYTA